MASEHVVDGTCQNLTNTNVFNLTDWHIKACYHVFLHPLRAVPGPFLAKIFPLYMARAMVEARRAQVR